MSASTHFALVCACRGPRGIITRARHAPGKDHFDRADEEELRWAARRLGWRRVAIPITGPDAQLPGTGWAIICPDCADRAGLLTPAQDPAPGLLTPRPVRHLAVHPDGTITR